MTLSEMSKPELECELERIRYRILMLQNNDTVGMGVPEKLSEAYREEIEILRELERREK